MMSPRLEHLVQLAKVYSLLILLPVVPIAILYFFFGQMNYFGFEGWKKGLVASGPIAAYIFILHFGFSRFLNLLSASYQLRRPIPNFIIGNWNFESETIQSGKKSSGTVTFNLEAGELKFSGLLEGEDGDRFAVARSDFCFFDANRNLLRILYRMEVLVKDGNLAATDCIGSSFIVSDGSDGPATMKGNWIQISGGDGFSGKAILTKLQQSEAIDE